MEKRPSKNDNDEIEHSIVRALTNIHFITTSIENGYKFDDEKANTRIIKLRESIDLLMTYFKNKSDQSF